MAIPRKQAGTMAATPLGSAASDSANIDIDRSLGAHIEMLCSRQGNMPLPPILTDRHHIYLTDVPDYAPPGPNGRKTHISTCLRWRDRGVRGVKLEAFRWGNRWVTSMEALSRFIGRISLGPTEQSSLPSPSKSRQAYLDRADRHLDEAGI